MNKEKDRLTKILYRLFEVPELEQRVDLKELFENRINELEISRTNACEILDIQIRTLNGILDGSQKSVDYTNLIKLAAFLQRPKEHIVNLYIESIEKNFPEESVSSMTAEKVEFIKENFDLAVLKKVGFIDSITNYKQIESKINSFFGLEDILNYERPPVDVAFSEGKLKPKNELNRSFWIKSASDIFYALNNPYQFDREALIEYFPKIRWHSISIELGLTNVIKVLYKLGLTVIYLESLPSLHLRGATFSVNEKPCIVLTNYKGFYPTIWFALIHELFHVIFDWDEIRTNRYHLSDEETEQLTVKEKEQEANEFAREYLFSKEKTQKVKAYLNNQEFIEEFAKTNHVHPSFIYVFHAYDIGNKDRIAWARAKRESPNFEDSIKHLNNSWNNSKPIFEFVKSIKTSIYN